MPAHNRFLAALRLLLATIFLWPFFDKVFGLGFATAPEKAWLAGNSPTSGFLSHAHGPFGDLFRALAGQVWVDWLFMIGLLLIGLALLFGVGMRIAGYSGALLLILMWLSALPPQHNPVLDEHIIYAVLLLMLAHTSAGEYWGLGKWWGRTRLVQRYQWLK